MDKLAEQRAALKNIREGLATRVRVLASRDSCPACRAMEGAYELNEAPQLPVEGCSHALGCRCFYEPVLEEIYP